MKVKVCGIKTYSDAKLALDHGVDALGFNFYPNSPRYITPSDCRDIVRRLPPFTVTVGVIVNVRNPSDASDIAREARITVLQLHGDEPPDYCRLLFPWPLIKALWMEGSPIEENLRDYPVQAFLLDSRDDVRYGGTGRAFRWSLAEPVKKFKPVILSGGLNSDNVGEAIRIVCPYGVDVCSGVESSPGVKDAAKLRAFMNEVRNVIKGNES